MKDIKKSCNNSKFKISAPTWKEKFELPDRSSSMSDIQDYFKYIIKKLEAVSGNVPIRMYVNKIENRVAFRIKTGYYLELLSPKTVEVPGSTKSKIAKNENGENVPHLETTEVVIVHLLSTIIISMIQESCKRLFLINLLVSLVVKTF